MKRYIALLLLVLLVLQPVFADYVPYAPDEFPQWSIKLRRAETLAFGALPITLGLTGLTYATARGLGAGTFSDDPFTDSLAVIGIAGALAIVVALADYIIGEMQD
ncbi:MAG: hypothetical protein WCY74_00530 [Sphaerochaetaceae bacterium]|jgi:hypothetical protein|nr:hypothetical protein [Sphaerochaetaceae bacterium]MDD3941195.1 hypothetical protein [Sphaerochaetaceae bacterium]MDX9938924.1 hypothetical protein [Sphaerochaetaceae bacterium]